MKTAEADNKYQRILLLFDRFLQSTENQSLYTHWLIREKKLRFALLESYAKEHAIEFGKNAFEAGYKYSTGNDSPDWEKWYSEWINQQTK